MQLTRRNLMGHINCSLTPALFRQMLRIFPDEQHPTLMVSSMSSIPVPILATSLMQNPGLNRNPAQSPYSFPYPTKPELLLKLQI